LIFIWNAFFSSAPQNGALILEFAIFKLADPR